MYFGNWEEVMIGQWGGLEILVSQETSDAFQKNQTWIRVLQEVDIGLRHPESSAFARMRGHKRPGGALDP